MAKHPHRLILNQKKTWRCTLPGCNWFIHRGLEHILPGKQAICWECGEEFTLSERALRDDMPICDVCRAKQSGTNMDELEEFLKKTPEQIKEELSKSIDEVEVIEADDMIVHNDDCDIWTGQKCNCS